jgi:hypothetical protein
MTDLAIGSEGDFVKAYEALRAHILTGSTAGSPGGLIVLLRQGMASWMKLRQGRLGAQPQKNPNTAPFKGNDIYADIVRVLANIAIGKREMHA